MYVDSMNWNQRKKENDGVGCIQEYLGGGIWDKYDENVICMYEVLNE